MTLKKFFFLNMHKTNNGRIVKIKIIGPLINTPTAEINQKNSLIIKYKKLSFKPINTIKLLATTTNITEIACVEISVKLPLQTLNS